ncbi:cytochrome c biogenesis CcdA family protein [Aerococcaceae bacterium NML160702]|nr:cytochrome c biogenesis CcdA family protein [Aerococcaceae bacterium NML191219]MCW6682175.1 cytochrome c biogenesis CcdA family protein [Aerococcaceae bacterium NML160702]
MQYVLLMLEGVLTFISPCLLPMIPIYIAYLTGNSDGTTNKKQAFVNAILFVAGFTTIFLAMNLLVSSIGQFVLVHRRFITIVSGLWIILLGIDFLLDNRLLSRLSFKHSNTQVQGNAFIFGIVFSISWTPCVGTFLATAMTQALLAEHLWQSMLMLLCYCIGLGIPFILTAIMLEDLQQTLSGLKRHLTLIKRISACILILLGTMILFGWYDHLMAWFN